MTKAKIDERACAGFRTALPAAPEVFKLNQTTNNAQVILGHIPIRVQNSLARAVGDECPTAAIETWDGAP